jgi:general L-amino acid transport system permease protein
MTRKLIGLLGAGVLAWLAWSLLDWALLSAVFRPDAQACAAIGHQGACWGVVIAKAQPLLLGFYPEPSQWRPITAMLISALACAASAWALLTKRRPQQHRAQHVIAGLALALLASLALMRGGFAGLELVPAERWGGLPLTLALFASSWLASMPLAVLLALARRSRHRLLSWPATTAIELVRGVPLVTLLFAFAFLLPALLPDEWRTPLIWRGGLALTLFSAAYFAEVLRGGLQTIPQEQSEAAAILGLSWWQTQRLIVLPQALRAVLPASVGHAIGLLKDSSLVTVIGLHELTGGLSLSLGGDAVWRPYYLEAYLFVGLLYGLMCLALSRFGTAMESRLPQGRT